MDTISVFCERAAETIDVQTVGAANANITPMSILLANQPAGERNLMQLILFCSSIDVFEVNTIAGAVAVTDEEEGIAARFWGAVTNEEQNIPIEVRIILVTTTDASLAPVYASLLVPSAAAARILSRSLMTMCAMALHNDEAVRCAMALCQKNARFAAPALLNQIYGNDIVINDNVGVTSRSTMQLAQAQYNLETSDELLSASINLGLLFSLTYTGHEAPGTTTARAYDKKLTSRLRASGATDAQSLSLLPLARLSTQVSSETRRTAGDVMDNVLRLCLEEGANPQVSLVGKYQGLTGPVRVGEAFAEDEEGFLGTMSSTVRAQYEVFHREVTGLARAPDGDIIGMLEQIQHLKAAAGTSVLALSAATYRGLYRHSVSFVCSKDMQQISDGARSLGIQEGSPDDMLFQREVADLKRALDGVTDGGALTADMSQRTLLLKVARFADNVVVVSAAARLLSDQTSLRTARTLLQSTVTAAGVARPEILMRDAFELASLPFKSTSRGRRAEEIRRYAETNNLVLPDNVRVYLDDLEFDSVVFEA